MTSKFLILFKPFVRITPEIKQPQKEITFKTKLIYTLIVLVLYIIMSNIQVYGIDPNQGTDYYYWLRVILASKRGTLTEMGIGPIVTAGMIMQLLQGSKLIHVDLSDPSDRALFTGAQKVLTIILTIFQIIAYLVGGAYGTLTMGTQILIFIQLLASGLAIILMDEILQKGYGLGSGVSLFIATGVAGQIFWNSFSHIPITTTGADGLPRGIIIAFFTVLFRGGTFPTDFSVPALAGQPIHLWNLFIRQVRAPDFLGLIMTFVIFFVAIYFQLMRIEIPLTYAGTKGYRGKYPMNLLYVSNIPVILAQALYANVLFLGQILWNATVNNPAARTWAGIFGKFTTVEQGQGGSYLNPTGGLVYYLSPPQGLSSIITALKGGEPVINLIIHSVVYLSIFILVCVVFGAIWVEVSGLAPRDIAGQILSSKMQIPGFRRTEKIVEKILKRYIPTLTILCGIIVGLLSFSADFMGALSSGTGLLLTVGIIQNYAETIGKEAAKEQMPGMAALLG